jgi:hypothetical protein
MRRRSWRWPCCLRLSACCSATHPQAVRCLRRSAQTARSRSTSPGQAQRQAPRARAQAGARAQQKWRPHARARGWQRRRPRCARRSAPARACVSAPCVLASEPPVAAALQRSGRTCRAPQAGGAARRAPAARRVRRTRPRQPPCACADNGYRSALDLRLRAPRHRRRRAAHATRAASRPRWPPAPQLRGLHVARARALRPPSRHEDATRHAARIRNRVCAATRAARAAPCCRSALAHTCADLALRCCCTRRTPAVARAATLSCGSRGASSAAAARRLHSRSRSRSRSLTCARAAQELVACHWRRRRPATSAP